MRRLIPASQYVILPACGRRPFREPVPILRHLDSGMVVELERHLFTVEDYHRMEDAGILIESPRVELIEGNVEPMSPVDGSYTRCVGTITHLVVDSVGCGACISVGGSVRLNRHSELQPDIAVLRRPPEGCEPPGIAEILLLIEVSDSTLVTDLNLKAPLYARAGVPDVWLVDLNGEVVTRHSGVRDGEYRLIERLRRGDRMVATVMLCVEVDVESLFA